jgi:hypothetical protein
MPYIHTYSENVDLHKNTYIHTCIHKLCFTHTRIHIYIHKKSLWARIPYTYVHTNINILTCRYSVPAVAPLSQKYMPLLYVCMYLCMYVCMHVRRSRCSSLAKIHVSPVCMYACMHVRRSVCVSAHFKTPIAPLSRQYMLLCMYVYLYIYPRKKSMHT